MTRLLLLSLLLAAATVDAATPEKFHPRAIELDGVQHVAFPNVEAEYFLWLHTQRAPDLEAAIKKHEELDALQIERVKNATTSVALLTRTTSRAIDLADMWQASAEALAEANTTSLFEDIFGRGGVRIWIAAALVGGIVIGKELAD